MTRATASNLPHLPEIIDSAHQVPALAEKLLAQHRSILVKGPAGMGKTSLALHSAQQILKSSDSPFDFVYQATARATPWATLSDILDPVARFLGNEAIPAADSIDQKLQLFRSELGDRIGLLILDNIETVPTSVIDMVGSISEQLTILYTSRTYPEIQDAPDLFKIEPLADADVVRLICERAGWPGAPEILKDSELVRLIAGNPLAAKWSGGRLRNGIPLASLEARLSDGDGDLFSKLFSDNWRDSSPNAHVALITASLLGSTISYDLLARAVKASRRDAEDALAELYQVSLLDISRPGTEVARVNAHPLVRSYAAMRYDAMSADDRRNILASILEALILFCEERSYLQRGREAYDAIDDEIESLLVRVGDIHELPADTDRAQSEHLLRLTEALSVYLWRRGRWAERVALSVAAANIALQLGEGVRSARAFASAGIVKHWQGDPSKAREFATSADAVLSRVPHRPIDSALITRLNGLIDHSQRGSRDALIKMLTVLDSIREADHQDHRNQAAIRLFADWPCAGEFGFRAGEVAILQEIGIIYTDLGIRADAEYWLGRSIQVADEIGDEEGKAIALSHRGRASILHNLEDAEDDFSEALKLAIRVGRRSTEGRALLGLAQAGHGDHGKLVEYARRARVIFAQLGMSNELESCANRLEALQS